MNYTPAALIRERLNDLEGVHRNAVLKGGALRNAFVRKQSLELNVAQETVAYEIEKVSIVEHERKNDLSLLAEMELEKIELLSQAEKEAQQAQWHQEFVLIPWAKADIIKRRMEIGYTLDDAQAQGYTEEEINLTLEQYPETLLTTKKIPKDMQERNKYNVLMSDIVTILKQHPKGMNKTDILTLLKKNGNWREMRNDVLDYLEIKGQVRKIGTKYYHISKVDSVLETDFHRRVYEALAQTPLSINGIVNLKDTNGNYIIGYNNPSGRRKVKAVLMLLWKEGLVSKEENGRWAIS